MNLPLNPNIMDQELDLIGRLQRGDANSFEFIVREYGGYLMTIARRYLNSDADVQDCVQDTFLQAFKSVKNFQGRSSLKSWLHRIVVNAALMKLRAQGRRPESFIDDDASLFNDDGSRIATEPEISHSVEVDAIDKQTRACVRRYINELPDVPRKLLLLRDIEGYSTEETAQILGMSISAIKTGLHRARRTLKQAIDAG